MIPPENNSRLLIVGSNSRLVNQLRKYLDDRCDFISHRDLHSTNVSNYKHVIVFSWDYRSLENNIKLLRSIPPAKVVLISSTAVFAIQIRRQWSSYPNNKSAAERFVLQTGGRVLRVGITEAATVASSYETVAFTSYIDLAKAILAISGKSDSVVNVFTLVAGGLAGWKRWLSIMFGNLSDILPANTVFQAPLVAFLRGVGISSRGYTRDANRAMSREILVGYGVLGQCYHRIQKDRPLVLVSHLPDELHNESGFRKTFVGRDRTGLAKYWHGVGLRHIGDEFYEKVVPLFVRRGRMPRHARYVHVTRIIPREYIIELHGDAKNGSNVVFFCQRVVLAAGAIENARILSSLVSVRATFSDHEIGMFGTIDLQSAIQDGLVHSYGLIVRRRKAVRITSTDSDALVEVRPFAKMRHHGSQDAAFYLDSVASIITKVIRSLSWSRINEAIFNKTGWAFRTRRLSVFVQLEAKDCITFDGNLTRNRLGSSAFASVHAQLLNRYKSYIPDEEVYTIDAQHVLGGAALLDKKEIAQLVRSGRMTILGSPTSQSLGALHHTPDLCSQILAIETK